MKQTLNKWLKNSQTLNIKLISKTIFKQKCLLCDAPEANIHGLCRACTNALPWHPDSSCPQCGLASQGIICGTCLNKPPHFDATYAAFSYAYPIHAMIVRYKYGNMLSLSEVFGKLFFENVILK